MKTLPLAGIVLIVLGIGALAYQGITYTSRETVVDIGPVHATADREKTIPLSPIAGGVAVAAGGGLGGGWWWPACAGARSRIGHDFDHQRSEHHRPWLDRRVWVCGHDRTGRGRR